MSYNRVACLMSVGKTRLKRVIFFCGDIEGGNEFQLHAAGQLAALARAGDHLVRDLLSRRRDKVVRF